MSEPATTAEAPFLDRILTTAEAAEWLKLKPRTLHEMVRRGQVPVVRVSSREWRFHPRTVLEALKS